ncbi:MAG: transporter substrate-binding domain-containing protein, partial [Methylococcales bacterium]|nr:transporter substrate-binding domain-containing protein [Methylococcales bacterium]
VVFLWILSFCLSLPTQAIANTVRSASELAYPPFSIVLDDGVASGFSVELMREALKVMGHKVTYEVSPWSIIKQNLEQGKLDALPLVGRTPEREKLFDFTFPYIKLYGAVFVRNDENDINNISDLSGRRVGVMRNDNAEEFMLREHITDQLISTSSFKDAFLQLSTGKIDAVVVQQLVGISLIDELKLNNIKTALAPLKGFRQDFCFAVTKGNKELLADLNEGLSIVIANKTYDQLHSKWLGILSRDKEEANLFWIINSSVTYFFAAILLCLYFYQQKKAHKKLKESEDHLRISQLYGNIGTWEADFITNKEIWSEAVTNTLGFPKVAEPTWDLFLETIHPEDREHVLTIINGHLNEDKACDVEYRIIDTQGKIRWMHSVGKAEFDSNGNPLKLRGTVQEITGLKIAEHEVAIRTEELTKAVRIKSDFLSNMSHEIR